MSGAEWRGFRNRRIGKALYAYYLYSRHYAPLMQDRASRASTDRTSVPI
jgi:hypothetical protein